jgi:hypothetical protein
MFLCWLVGVCVCGCTGEKSPEDWGDRFPKEPEIFEQALYSDDCAPVWPPTLPPSTVEGPLATAHPPETGVYVGVCAGVCVCVCVCVTEIMAVDAGLCMYMI